MSGLMAAASHKGEEIIGSPWRLDGFGDASLMPSS